MTDEAPYKESSVCSYTPKKEINKSQGDTKELNKIGQL